jgi:hypothetical protein
LENHREGLPKLVAFFSCHAFLLQPMRQLTVMMLTRQIDGGIYASTLPLNHAIIVLKTFSKETHHEVCLRLTVASPILRELVGKGDGDPNLVRRILPHFRPVIAVLV